MVTGTAAGSGGAQGQQGVSSPVALSAMIAPAQAGPLEPQKRVASEHRRSNKPIMEKRRRARINNCLNELKALILDAMKKDPARHSKLEKADILEMTVKHLESLQRQRGGGGEGEPAADRFRAGFRECAAEVGRFPGIEPVLRRRLLQHLAACVAPAARRPRLLPTPPSDAEEPAAIFIGAGPGAGVRLVPTRLPNGDLALVLPAGGCSSAPPTLVPIPARTDSTASASSSASSDASWGSSPPPAPCSPAPLSLVTRRDADYDDSDDRPWRPW